MQQSQLLDLLERAYNAGCFTEVLKMIRAGSSEVVIEKVIEKCAQKAEEFSFNFDEIFGSD